MHKYKSKKTSYVSGEEAILRIQKGKRIIIGSGCAAPQHLVQELVNNHTNFYDNEICHIMTVGDAPYSEPKYAKSFRHNGFFIGHNVRDHVNEGDADYIPVFLNDVPHLLGNQLPVHCVLVNISPPNEHGYVSLGTSVDVLPTAISNADVVIGQMNKHVPFTYGPCLIPLDAFDCVVQKDEPLAELIQGEPDEISKTIGSYLSEYVKDGATLQLGIGGIPDAILRNLHDRNDMGIHSEMVSDGIIDLCENGNINNMLKNINPGKIVTSFVLGSKKIFDFVNENHDVEFWPTEYTNDIRNIETNDNVISVNSAIQIDLTGQVCSDSIGKSIYSGFGGQVDFVRGARRSKGGKSFIAMPSTASNGTISRIVPHLSESSGVVTSRADVQFIATEYGVAYLHGRNLRERGLALAEIAHPDFREDLLASLKNRKVVCMNQEIPMNDDRAIRYCIPRHHEFDGLKIFFRPLKSDDIRILQDFFYTHESRTVRFRYHQLIKSLPLDEAKKRVSIDYKRDMAIAGFKGDEPYSEMLCIGRYYDIGNNIGEMGLVVKEELQNFGIGTFMLNELIDAAKKQGKKELVGHVLRDNTNMSSVLKKAGFTSNLSNECDGFMYSLEL